MGKYQDYDDYAEEYAHTRHAFSWVLNPLIKKAKTLTDNSTIIEIGCGTGNYIIALSKMLPNFIYKAFDISKNMLSVAKSRSDAIEFSTGNAEDTFPYSDSIADFSFAVDVVHHITNLNRFFNEVSRTLKPDVSFILVTDLEENIRKRSLTKYFPEILEIEVNRYPGVDELYEIAKSTNLKILELQTVEGYIELNDDFISKLERKCSSAMRLLTEEKLKEGIKRVIKGQKRGEKWLSSYTIINYQNVK